tara:strand:+ start:1093 stop:1494 length:402 start_codon:yes stop_codon:yes gene_type:complete
MACSCGRGRCSPCSQRTSPAKRGYRTGGLITQGSGKINPETDNLKLTVDDVPAKIIETGEEVLIGNQEYLLNSGVTRKVGVKYLDALNAIGLEDNHQGRGVRHQQNNMKEYRSVVDRIKVGAAKRNFKRGKRR